MFDELKKYKHHDHFFFSSEKELATVCNAPKDKSGVYIVFELKNGSVELVYIGSSGKIQNTGEIDHRNGALYDKIVREHQFGKRPWKQKLIDEKIDALDVYWYDTTSSENMDIPVSVETAIKQRFFEVHGYLPRWNEES